MQGLDIHRSYDKRAEYNVAHLLNHYTSKGTDWKDIPKVFQISVLNFIYDATTSDTLAVYQMQTKNNHHLSDRMTVVFIELPKLMDNVPDEIEKLTPAEKWGKFLIYADDELRQDFIRRLCTSEEGIMAANVTLAKISKDEANWLRQTALDKGRRDYLSGINEATRRGLEDGLKQGLELGLKEGRENTQKKFVENALKMNLTIEQISQLTGLSEDVIESFHSGK